MKYKVGNEIFESSAEAYEYCIEEDISVEEIEEVEEESLSIDETPEPEEYLEEQFAITEEERRGAIVLENYDSIEDETLKKQILSVSLGQSTDHDQKFEEPIKISEVPEKYLKRFGEKVKVGVCPECSMHYTQLGSNLSKEAEEDLKEELVLDHISKEHPKVWEMIQHLHHIPEKSDLPNQQVTRTSNPESCSGEMSKEELSREIASNPDLRANLFRRWKTQKETKNRRQ